MKNSMQQQDSKLLTEDVEQVSVGNRIENQWVLLLLDHFHKTCLYYSVAGSPMDASNLRSLSNKSSALTEHFTQK